MGNARVTWQLRLPSIKFEMDPVLFRIGTFEVTRVTTSVHPKSVVLTIENTGEKLTPQFVSTLSEPFRRGTERIRTDHAGVGLGLAIVKSITEAHDGTLTLTPRPAGGLRVTVHLPAAPTSGLQPGPTGCERS